MKISYLTCPTSGCGYSPFPVDEGFETRARRTHERFWCPGGHRQYFPGESDVEKLQRECETLATSRDWWQARYEAERSTCHWNGCNRRVFMSPEGLASHMRMMHGMPSMKELAEMYDV